MNAPNDCFTHHLIWQQGVRRNIAVFCVIGANLNFVGFFSVFVSSLYHRYDCFKLSTQSHSSLWEGNFVTAIFFLSNVCG